MMLAQCYAQILREQVDVKKVLAYMKKRGHLSLLKQVVRVLERTPEAHEQVLVAHEKDISKMKKKFPDAHVVVDEKIVGGYVARNGTTVTDASYRHALVTLYHNTIH